MKKTILATVILALAVAAAAAVGAAIQKEHPLIKPFPGSKFVADESEYKNYHFYEYRYYDPVTDDTLDKVVKGEYWQLCYSMQDENGEPLEGYSAFEVVENYSAAARERGGKVVWDNAQNGEAIFTIPLSDGSTLWAYVEAYDHGMYYLYIVEEEGFKQKLSFGAEELKKELDASGRVAIYGIYFDTNKASLKPESITALDGIVKAMINYSDLKLEIQGHTDNTGTDEVNNRLSQQRAETVRSYLVLFGVDGARLTAAGFGASKPVAPNDTEEGKAKNRRVELVKK
ncbi:MAG TPA: OmpA family protein [Acidobacteriota bacterium]|nr:OmpA family protein [Acidobacteriota bacterium]